MINRGVCLFALRLFLILFIGSSFQCTTSLEKVPFEGPRSVGVLDNPEIDEASGLAPSLNNPGYLWTHNDSGDRPRLFMIDTLGKHAATLYLEGAMNRDWEDVAIGPGPVKGRNYLYIGEIGDNKAQYNIKSIYRFEEPNYKNREYPITDTIKTFETIRFTYPDGRRDAETLLLDPNTRDLYIVSKREARVKLYKLPYPQSSLEILKAELITELPFSFVVGGDISADGTEILLKTYTDVFYWKKNPEDPIEEVLLRFPISLPYNTEPQGEAICWNINKSGYYTLSEETDGVRPVLYFYPRVK